MVRVKLDLPKAFNFKTELMVRVTDLNYGGHLGNADTLALLHEARVRFLREIGYTEGNVEGFGTIMVDAVLQFKAQAFCGEVLVAEVCADNFSRIGYDIFYRLTNKQTGVVVAVAKTGIALFDYEKQKRISPFEEVIKKLSA